MKKRDFLKTSAALASTTLIPSSLLASFRVKTRLRTAHIGVGAMGAEDLKSIASHKSVDVVALCDVDSKSLQAANQIYPDAKIYKDYRVMLKDITLDFDAVIVSTPDHTHAPASIMAMQMNKHVYCQKPLTHFVSEAREMRKLAENKSLITQMGIQVHSFYDYKLATILIQSGIIGKVHTVRAWTDRNFGYDGPAPIDKDSIPDSLDWNLWLGTSPERSYKETFYHPSTWRKLVDYGCGTLGDMGIHIFDTPYNALALDFPLTIKNKCRKPNGYGYPESNKVTYTFPGTPYTADTLTWIWSDGPGSPLDKKYLELPNNDKLPLQGSMFIGEKGRLLLPHFMESPRYIVDGEYKEIDVKKYDPNDTLGERLNDYGLASPKHYHQFVDSCLGRDEVSAPFSYSSRLTETILLGVIAGRFPNKTLNWDGANAQFKEGEANQYLLGSYRDF